jgi:hypothetical protein
VLDPLSTWTDKIKALPSVKDPVTGVTNFVAAISSLTNKVQAGPTGQVGIFVMDQPTFIAQLSSLSPFTPTWSVIMATAWQASVLASVIVPNTVTDPLWTSSNTDSNTLPAAAATIITIPAAFASLTSDLAAISSYFLTQPTDSKQIQAKHPEAMAKAFRDATLQFQFNCIGLVSAIVPIPTPKVFPAQ